jgi:hypothetical protein
VPVAGTSVADVMVNRATKPPVPLHAIQPKLPPTVWDAVAKALANDPQARFPDCASFAKAVLTGLDGPIASTAPAVSCPKCNKAFRWTREKAGTRVRCTACQTAFIVPTEDQYKPVVKGTPAPRLAQKRRSRVLLFAGLGCLLVAGLVVVGAIVFGILSWLSSQSASATKVVSSTSTEMATSPPISLPSNLFAPKPTRELVFEDTCDSKETSKIKSGFAIDDRVYKSGTVTATNLLLATLDPGDYECEIRVRLALAKTVGALDFGFSYENDDKKAAVARDIVDWVTDANSSKADRHIWVSTDVGTRKDRDISLWSENKRIFTPTEMNKLKLTVRGQKFTFSVNDKVIQEATVPLTDRTGKADEKGKFRFFVLATLKQKVELDEVRVWRLNGP